MSDRGQQKVGERIAHYRRDAGLTASELAEKAGISKSYLSELESGDDRRPSAETLYAIGKALGVAMSDLLGRPIIVQPSNERPKELLEFAKAHDLPEADVAMLAGIQFRGEAPKSPKRWEFIYQAIKNSAAMDRS